MFQVGNKIRLKKGYEESYMAKEEYTIIDYTKSTDSLSFQGLNSNQVHVWPVCSLNDMFTPDVKYNRTMKLQKICSRLER
jgi:hypothetical protein